MQRWCGKWYRKQVTKRWMRRQTSRKWPNVEENRLESIRKSTLASIKTFMKGLSWHSWIICLLKTMGKTTRRNRKSWLKSWDKLNSQRNKWLMMFLLSKSKLTKPPVRRRPKLLIWQFNKLRFWKSWCMNIKITRLKLSIVKPAENKSKRIIRKSSDAWLSTLGFPKIQLIGKMWIVTWVDNKRKYASNLMTFSRR